MNKVTKDILVAFIKSTVGLADDQTAVKAMGLYAEWKEKNEDGTATHYEVGDRKRYTFSDGVEKLCSCRQEHDSTSLTNPEDYPAGWLVIDVEHSGTVDDPIPYDPNMVVYGGKYYIYEEVIYKCTRDSGVPLYTTPDALLNNYFELA